MRVLLAASFLEGLEDEEVLRTLIVFDVMRTGGTYRDLAGKGR